ncbi:procathepsin L-like [Physella acuta]|uniref:procathepsin L-like n=1 Tax=Physella acuta TaxID=109671 RepID=UPI0027DDE55F|nr:procathepsin L-like [Physella acuta]
MANFYITYLMLAACLAACLAMAAATTQERWELYKEKHNKNYPEHLERIKREIWRSNVELIEKHNARYARGVLTYKVNENKFADELAANLYVNRDFYEEDVDYPCTYMFNKSSNKKLPKVVDWRSKGYVTPVKDQGECGSCWAFSAVGSLEGQNFKATGKLTSLSESQLVDCSTTSGNDGCDGGNVIQAFHFIKEDGGIDSAENYPYTPEENFCKYIRKPVAATVRGSVCIPPGDEDALKEAVATIGPVSVTIDADDSTFALYDDGVYYTPNCSSNTLTHAVLVVGYGSLKGQDYWLVKNSYGTTWGKSGFMLMARNKGNHCGIASAAVYPLVGNNGHQRMIGGDLCLSLSLLFLVVVKRLC